MRRVLGASCAPSATAGVLASAAGLATTTSTKDAYYYAFRRYTEDSKDSKKHSDGKEAAKSEFAKMDVRTKNTTPGTYKDVERAAIKQEEGKKPLPEGVATANHTCCGDHGHDLEHHHSHSSPEVANSQTSTFARIFKEEAAAMMPDKMAEQPHPTPSFPGGSTGTAFPLPPKVSTSNTSTSSTSGPTPSAGKNANLNLLGDEVHDMHHQQKQQREAYEEMQRFLAQNTIRSIQQSAARDAGNVHSVLGSAGHYQHDDYSHPRRHGADARLPPGRRGVQALLDYNKQWAAEVSQFNPRYFQELAKEQKPEYLWIGCSDSRVPANEVVGLHPGDVFVHRNIGNIFSLSDLNCLSALQFAVDSIKVQHVIIAGHYKCGGVTAAMNGTSLGLTDHWIMQVTDIKNKFWDRVTLEIPEDEHLNVLCELNVLQQLSHTVNCRIVQRLWSKQNVMGRYSRDLSAHVHVRPRYASDHNLRFKTHPLHYDPLNKQAEDELECHGWVYSLDDGMLRPLLSLNRLSSIKKDIEDATEAVFIRYSSR